jgi:phosphate transport system permease protein
MSTVTATPSNPASTPTGDNSALTPPRPGAASLQAGFGLSDKVYGAVIFLASLAVLVIIAGIALLLLQGSGLAIHKLGLGFLTTSTWDEQHLEFGAKPYILGTLYCAFWALLIAVPISLGSAIFLSEMAPKWLRVPLAFLIELLAAIPSIVYGIWGVFVLSPWICKNIEGRVHGSGLKNFLLFRTTVAGQEQALSGYDMLSASIILAIMVTPYITSVSRDILRAIPRIVRDGSYALGATQWETISGVVLPYARAGIIGAVILGLGRALGETMAVTMVIGNSNKIFTPSLFVAGNTMASAIANNFTNATTPLEHSAYFEIGLILFLVTMVVNAGARVLVMYTAKDLSGGSRK